MDIEAIKRIINNESLMPFQIESQIISVLAESETVINDVLKILEAERQFKNKMGREMNNLISKMDTALDNPLLNENGFMQKQVKQFHKFYSKYYSHNFK